MPKRSLFVQTSTLPEDQVVPMITRAKNDPEIVNLVMADWSEQRAAQIKDIIPYNPTGNYKRLFTGNPAPTTQDYRAILDGDWRWNNLTAAEAAAQKALPYSDGWYISYETGMNVFSSEAFREPWEWYLGDMVRKLRAIKDVPFIWSPYLVGPVTTAAVDGWARTMSAVTKWYSPGASFNVHVQDGVGAHLQTTTSATLWAKAMKAKNVVPVSINVEWFDASNGYTPVNAEAREQTYITNGIPIGTDWEIRYWYAIQTIPTSTLETLLQQYLLTVSAQPRAGQAPDNRLHATDTSGPYYIRRRWTSQWGRNLIAQFPGLFSLGQWRALSVVPTPGSGRDPNSDHYSGGAYDFGGPKSLLDRVATIVNTDQTVGFAQVHGSPLHLHVSHKLEGDFT